MSPRRVLGEAVLMGGVLLGTCIGYAAGTRMEPAAQMSLAFLGMALGGAFVDFCQRGGKP